MTEDPNTVPNFLADKNDNISLSNITINPSVVFERLASLKCGKAPGPDGWPIEVFKKCTDHLCTPLSILFMKSLESGILPQDWKTGHIKPVYKKGNKTKINNYRPVCLTSIVIKAFESIIRDTMFMTITYFHQTKMDLFLEGHVAHSYYMLLMIGLYHLTNIFLLM